MYQMYAYQKKYNVKNITMLYPITEQISQKIEHEKEIQFTSDDGVIVMVRFVDLFDIKKKLIGIDRPVTYKNIIMYAGNLR